MMSMLRMVLVPALAVGLMGVATVTQASPHYGGDCHYCHTNEQPDAMAITGTAAVVDDLKLFEVERSGSVNFGFDVNNPDSTEPYYRLVLRGLDFLNGEVDQQAEITPYYLPRLYTPDPTWNSQGPDGQQYLFWEGQYYSPQGASLTFGPAAFSYHLEVGPAVAPGLYELTAFVGGGFPDPSTPGHQPVGGWSYEEQFLLRVVPEPSSVFLLIVGVALFGLGRWWRRWAVPVALVLIAGLLTADVAHAYPSRSGDCAICHSIPGPSAQTGDFAIKDAAGNPTTSFTVAAGGATEFLLEFTQLLEDPLVPGSFRRAYMIVDRLDFLNTADPADFPYTAPNYTVDAEQWHNGRYVSGVERYIGVDGQYFAQNSTDPNASMPFPLELSPDVVPGDYTVTAKLVGGRPLDPNYHNGWTVTKDFTLTVTPAAAAAQFPEPGTFLLVASALPALWLCGLRRRLRPAET